jgi:hypothetical protein
MEDFIKNVMDGGKIDPPEECKEGFRENFSDAIREEWFAKKDWFEVIFYRDQLEHIALFSKDGILQEYKANLPRELLPEAIKKQFEENWEIMNSLLHNRGNSIEYELIIRDEDLTRYLVILTEFGKEVQKIAI